ncbi:MAG: hypothetical protein GY778_27755, partial [bacterium]|nr:hypothetical protein [bacterium]
TECGPGDHWVENCSAGLDAVADQQAKVGIDLDMDPDCTADISLRMLPCAAPDNLVLILRSDPRDDSQNFPGLRPVDGHMDVIDTRLTSMCLTADGITLRAGQGQGAPLNPSYGAIAEQPGDPALAASFFEVYFEIDLGGGQYLYNHEPMRLEGVIDCVPPQVGYIHLVDCIALYDAPQGGNHVANLTSAEHVVNPGPDPAVCCFEDGLCLFEDMEACFADGGFFHPEWESCDPNPCPQPGPCSACGPGDHWIDNCSAGLDEVADQAAKVGIDIDLDPDCTADISMVMDPCPAPNELVRISRSDPRDDSQQFPGLRPIDGHMDVIDTEILSMCLTDGNVTLRAGAGQGQGGPLPASYGAIAEDPNNPGEAQSFFEVYFEIDLGGGNYVYNQQPMRIEGTIDCVPPQVGYVHVVDCLPLYDAPQGGQHVANLTSAEHAVNPGEDPAGCCFENGTCMIMTIDECFAADGFFHPEWESCDPNPCPMPGPCTECGPGDHWIDTCSAGADEIADQAAKVGVDTDLDPNCVADTSMIMRPCPAPNNVVVITRSEPRDDSQNFAGTRPIDG